MCLQKHDYKWISEYLDIYVIVYKKKNMYMQMQFQDLSGCGSLLVY